MSTDRKLFGVFLLVLTLFVLISIDNVSFKAQIINIKVNYASTTLDIDSNPNDYVYSYVNLPLNYDYGSNLVPLTLAARIAPEGDFLELGMAQYSSPLLHKLCHDQRRDLVSADTSYEWLKRFLIYNATKFHKIEHLSPQNTLMEYGLDRTWSLVVVSHIYGDSRPRNAIDFAHKAQIIVAFDTNESDENIFLYDAFNTSKYFKHALKFSLYTSESRKSVISTSLFSNFVDLKSLLKPSFDRLITEFGHEVSY